MLVTRFPGCVGEGDDSDYSGWRQQCWLGPVTLPPQRLPGLTSAKATGATKAATLDNTRGNTGLTHLTPGGRGLHVTRRDKATYHCGGETSEHLHC